MRKVEEVFENEDPKLSNDVVINTNPEYVTKIKICMGEEEMIVVIPSACASDPDKIYLYRKEIID